MERKEAIILGLTSYITNRPCRNGHTAYRYTQSGSCSKCINKEPYNSIADVINRETKAIFLFSQISGYEAILAIADDFVSLRFPGVPPETVNQRPLNGKQMSKQVYQIVVRVPLENVDEMYAIGKLLLQTETSI